MFRCSNTGGERSRQFFEPLTLDGLPLTVEGLEALDVDSLDIDQCPGHGSVSAWLDKSSVLFFIDAHAYSGLWYDN